MSNVINLCDTLFLSGNTGHSIFDRECADKQVITIWERGAKLHVIVSIIKINGDIYYRVKMDDVPEIRIYRGDFSVDTVARTYVKDLIMNGYEIYYKE